MTEAAAGRFQIETYLQTRRQRVETALNEALPAADIGPDRLREAMRYSVFAGGKRLRPILAIATAEALENDGPAVSSLGAALELIHTYSLIHDDLPAMDDDDFRRGRPACHREFGEGIAILAGNALLTRAFQLLVDLPGTDPETRLGVQRHLFSAIDADAGIIAGQAIDLLSQGREIEPDRLEEMHRAKTGALIAASIGCAARLCDSSGESLAALDAFGRDIGFAFQIVDDVLDIDGSPAEMGKETGGDARRRKATYPGLHGVDASRRRAAALVESAAVRLDFLGEAATPLRELADFISVRRF